MNNLNDFYKIYKSFLLKLASLDALMEAVCICLGEDKDVKWKRQETEGNNKVMIQDFWDYSKKKLLNNKLIKRIQSYSEEKIR